MSRRTTRPPVALVLAGGGASFLPFAPEFSCALIELGQDDARRWLDQTHDVDELWQLGPA